jgi:ABC-type phosphate transport system substrate-binding protein
MKTPLTYGGQSATRIAALVVAGALALIGGGCGVSLHNASHPSSTSTLAADSVSATGHLPPRPQGEVEVDGRTRGSLTAAVAAAYEGSGARIVVSNNGEAQGFSALCRGQTDIVDSRRSMTPVELSVCQADGVQPVQIKVAANGAVLATGGEVDVGADCLTVAQVKQIFQAGSQITNWSQLGFYNIPLRVTGPREDRSLFDLFGETALGSESPTLANLRGDYEALSSEAAVRDAVTDGAQGATSAELHSNALASLGALHKAIGEAHGYVGEATFQVAKGIRDKRSTIAQARDRMSLEHADANLATLLGDLPAAERYVDQTGLETARFDSGLGAIGYFSLAYYQDHAEELRPLEIDSGAQRPQLNCIFPSTQTVADGSYPLSSELLLTVSLQDMRRTEVADFLRFYLAQAPELASAAGLVPLPAGMLNTEGSWLEGRSQPPIVSYAGPVASDSPSTTAAASTTTTPSELIPAGGAGDGVSSADVPTGAGVSAAAASSGSEASGEGEAPPQSTASPQSSQPLTPGQ